MAGTVDFVTVEPRSSTALTERLAEMVTEEALEQSGIGRKGDFPGPLFLAVAPVETEWPQRLEVGRAVGKTEFDVQDILRAVRGGQFAAYHHRFMFGSVAGHLAEMFGTKGSPISLSTACSSGATAIQLGVEAIRRGETDAALCVAAEGTVNQEALIRFSLLSALSTQNNSPQSASKPFSKNRDGFVMAEGAGALVLESYEVGHRARRADPRRRSPVAVNSPTRSTAPAPAPTASRASVACARHWRMPASPRSRSTTSTRTAPRRRKTTRWNIWRYRRCSAIPRRKFRCPRTNRWSATPSPRRVRSKPFFRC